MSDFSPRFPDALDSTMLSAFRSCPRKFYWECIRRLRPKGTSIHLHAGGAFARGLEVARKAYYDLGASQEQALQLGIAALLKAYGPEFQVDDDHAKSPRAMCEALIGYLDRWPFQTDYLQPVKQNGRHWIEFRFALPMPVNHPETGQPLFYTGRCDMVGNFNGMIYTDDEKTCSSMGEGWARQFDMRGQFMGYNWAARQHGFPVVGTIVRGIKLIKSGQDFAETIVMHSEAMLAQWYGQTVRDMQRMVQLWREGIWDMNFADSCQSFSGCPFARLDQTPSPEGYFDVYYQENTWNPLNKED